MFLSSSSNYPLGLDISDLSLKLVQLNKSRNKISIQALGKTDLPEGLIEDGEIKNKEEVIKMIRSLIAKPKYGRVSSGNVVACLPETKTFIKLIEISRSPNNMADVIETEMVKHIPYSIEEIYYDWQPIETTSGGHYALIGVAPKKIVNQYTEMLDEAKLLVEAMEIEPVAICRSILREESIWAKGLYNKNYAIIDIGATRTSMVVYSKNTIMFTISIPLSGEQITKTISENLKIETRQAEKAKIICGLEEDKARGVIKKILSEMIKELNEKINKALKFYNDNFSSQGPISEILLCGGGANIKGIEKAISQGVSIPIRKADTLINLGEAREKLSRLLTETYNLDIDLSKTSPDKANSLSIAQDSSLTFATAVGLALRGIFISEL